MNDAMATLLRDAYAHPDKRNLFYSTDGAETASERLNGTPWEWHPATTRRVKGASTCMFPLALGCPPTRTSEDKEWVEPLIVDPAQIADFEAPDVWSGRTGEVLRNFEQLAAETPADEFIRCPDIQSPLGVVELMWDHTFYFALLENPDPIHDLLDKVTDFIISFVRECQRLAGDRWNSAGFPPIWDGPGGTMVADDTMSLVSPEMHLEFSVPYVNRMAEQCGPLHYHSCSWYPHYFENIHQIGPVRAMNWNPGNSCDPALIIREFSGKAVLTPHIVLDIHRDSDVLKWAPDLEDEAALFRYMVEAMQDNTAMYFWFSNIRQKADQIEKMVAIAAEHGATPTARGVA